MNAARRTMTSADNFADFGNVPATPALHILYLTGSCATSAGDQGEMARFSLTPRIQRAGLSRVLVWEIMCYRRAARRGQF